MTLNEIKTILREQDLRLTKSLGQNFLHDANQIARVIGLAEVREGDRILEFGPGLGALTEVLLRMGASVLAVEKDARLCELLKARLGARLEQVCGDGLEFLRRDQRGFTGWKFVSNLPYSVASPILVEMALRPRGPEMLVVTVQREVADRIMAAPGSADYGILTLLCCLRYRPEKSFRIGRRCFFPVPEVDSTTVQLRRRVDFSLEDAVARAYVDLVKCAFNQRRKMVLKRLETSWPGKDFCGAFAELGIDIRARAEDLSREDFLGLARKAVE